MAILFFKLWPLTKNKNLPSSIKIAKVGTNVWQILMKPYQKLPKDWKVCQSVEISPNLVTLGSKAMFQPTLPERWSLSTFTNFDFSIRMKMRTMTFLSKSRRHQLLQRRRRQQPPQQQQPTMSAWTTTLTTTAHRARQRLTRGQPRSLLSRAR